MMNLHRVALSVSSFTCLLLAVPSLGSWLDTIGPSGSLRGSFYESDKRYTTASPLSTGSLWLNLKPEELAGVRSYVEGYLYGENLEGTFKGAWDLREAYLERSFGPLDFRVGRQINVWGRADKLNPTDNLTVRDQRLLFADDEEQRLGIGSLQAVLNFESVRLIGVWQPEWRRPLFAFPPLPAGISVVQRDPGDAYRQFALKIDTSGSDFDGSLSYYNGYDKTPDLALESVGGPSIVVGLVHKPIQAFGADYATTLGSYGLRAEVAYNHTEDASGLDPLVKNRNIFGVIGVERSLGESFSINAQYLGRYTFGFQDLATISDPNTLTLASQAYFVANQTQPYLQGLSLRLSYKAFNDTLESELAVVTWLGRGDYLIRPKIAYAFSDKWRGSVGAEWFGGGAGSFFGPLKALSTAYMELKYLY
jgi:hypothetical protein